MKGNLIVAIGLLILSLTLVMKSFIKLPNFLYLILLILAIIIELIGVIKMQKDNKGQGE